MITPFEITITLSEDEAALALSQYLAAKMGSEFSVNPSNVKFDVEMTNSSYPPQSKLREAVFRNVIATVTKSQEIT